MLGGVNETERDVLAHLHANSRTSVDNLAAALGLDRSQVEAAIDSLCEHGHVEREGDRLVPDAASHPTPGIFAATERTDAQPVEVDLSEDERD
jgi:predicted ArsR family transcriptional regulator